MTTAEQRLKGAHRLQVLADHLQENVPLDKFDMYEWFGVKPSSGLDRDDVTVKMLKDPKSPTRACAASHAALIPKFNRDGFRMSGHVGSLYPVLDGQLYAWQSIWLFFHLDEDEADHLFSISTYKDRKAPKSLVIRRIRAQARKMEKEADKLSTKGA